MEYKHGSPRADTANDLQLCGQAMCLEEMLCCDIPKGALYFGEIRRRVEVEFTEELRQEVRDCLDKMQRRRLMHLVDSQNLLKEEISLASFTAGFKLAWGLSKELEADGLYSFDEEETERVCRQVGKEE